MAREILYETDGARALRGWIARRYPKGGVPRFCDETPEGAPRKKRMDRIAVQRALNGEVRRISVDFAYMIEAATGGAVKWQLWLSSTAQAKKKAA